MTCKPFRLLLMSAAFQFWGCGESMEKGFLGSAVIETETFQAATTVQGALLSVARQEGEMVRKGEVLALVDTIPLHLRRLEIGAALAEIDAQVEARQAEVASMKTDEAGIKRELERIQGLVEKNAAPRQQQDDLATKAASAAQKVTAMELQQKALSARRQGLLAQRATLDDQIGRCIIRPAADGMVLTRYKNPGEILGPGEPVCEIGRIDTVRADFFVPEPLLAGLAVGKTVRLRMDSPDSATFASAVISWISPEAEFAPKNIQTREARTELVFRIRALAANPKGALKRGLPVEVFE